MRIGINLLPYTVGGQGGVEVYQRNLIQGLTETNSAHEFVLFVNKNSVGAYKPEGKQFSEVVMPDWVSKNRITRIIAEQILLPSYARQANVDCLFSNYVVPVLSGVPQIVNVHDMLFKTHPDSAEKSKQLYWSVMIPASFRKSKRIMTVSDASRVDMVRYYPNVADKIFVTVEGVNYSLAQYASVNPKMVADELGVTDPYVMSSATFAKHKNVTTLIKAFKQIADEFPKLKLVLTGRANTKDASEAQLAVIELIDQLALKEKVVFSGYVTTEMLAALYKGAAVHVIPSLYEGFGLPVIEAQFFDAPVICSDIPALSEIGGSGVLKADPLSADSFATAMRQILSDDQARTALIERGQKNLLRFGWQHAAQDLIDVCESAVNLPPTSKIAIT